MTALWISFCFAVIPPVIGALFVPETLGMRQIDFNEEKKEEKINKALSREEGGDYSFGGQILSMLSGDNYQEDEVVVGAGNSDYVEMTEQEQNVLSGRFV